MIGLFKELLGSIGSGPEEGGTDKGFRSLIADLEQDETDLALLENKIHEEFSGIGRDIEEMSGEVDRVLEQGPK